MYRRLQVPPDASAQQIRHAYRRLAHGVHPDAHPEDPEASRRFLELTEAYEILSSPERRSRYDLARRKAAEARGRSQRVRGDAASRPSSARLGGQTRTGGPVVIGASPLGASPLGAGPLGASPLALVAGPVRIVPSGVGPDVEPLGPGGELARLFDALWSAWTRF